MVCDDEERCLGRERRRGTYRTQHAARRSREAGWVGWWRRSMMMECGGEVGFALNKWRNGGGGGVREREMQSAESTAGEGCEVVVLVR
jgi:hypothetical protein